MIRLREGENEAVVERRLQEEFALDGERKNFALRIIDELTPGAVRTASYDDIKDLYHSFAARLRNEAGWAAAMLAAFSNPYRQPLDIDPPGDPGELMDFVNKLMGGEGDQLADAHTDELTPKGIALLRYLANVYERV